MNAMSDDTKRTSIRISDIVKMNVKHKTAGSVYWVYSIRDVFEYLIVIYSHARAATLGGFFIPIFISSHEQRSFRVPSNLFIE